MSSVFIGKLNGGQGEKGIVSLAPSGGTNPSDHYAAGPSSVFHTDMPHVFIQESYAQDLVDGNWGYWVQQMPPQIANYKSNDPNRVILEVLEWEWEGRRYKTILNTGLQDVTGQYTQTSSYQDDDDNGHIFGYKGLIDMNFTQSFAQGSYFAHGYYNLDTANARGHFDHIACTGTGRTLLRKVEGDVDSTRSNEQAERQATVTWTRAMGFDDNTGVVGRTRYGTYTNPDWMIPIGTNGKGFTHKWICQTSLQAAIGPIGVALNTAGTQAFGPASLLDSQTATIDGRWHNTTPIDTYATSWVTCREAATRWGGETDFLGTSWGTGISVKMIHYWVTNLRYDINSDSFTADNPFWNNRTTEQRISADALIINGMNLRTAGVQMLAQSLSVQAPQQGRPDMWYAGLNLSYGDLDSVGQDNGRLGCVGSNVGRMDFVECNYNNMAGHQLTVIDFAQIGSGFKLQTYGDNAPRIEGQYGDIWSPNNKPLKLFTSARASAEVGSDTDGITLNEYGIAELAVFNMGLPANEPCTVIMHIEFQAGDICCNKISNYWSDTGVNIPWIARRDKLRYDHPDNRSSHIFTLFPGRWVPFYSSAYLAIHKRSVAYDPMYKSGAFYIAIRHDNNGNITAAIKSRFPSGSRVVGGLHVPFMRITIQRLT